MIKYIAGFKLTQKLISLLGSMYVLFVYKTSTINLKNRKNIESLFKNGNLVHFIERHHIEGRPAEMIAENLTQAFDSYC